MRKRIAVVGSINTDITVSAPRLPQPGESLMVSGSALHQGGKGANQSVVAAQLGCAVVHIGMVGADDHGRAATANLQQHGVATEGIYETSQASTGLAVIILNQDGQNSILVDPGANLLLSAEHVLKARKAIGSADVLLLQLEVAAEANAAAVKIAKAAGRLTILDPGPIAQWSPDCLRGIDIVTPNQTEFAFIRNSLQIDEGYTDVEAAREVMEKTAVQVMVLKQGEKGAIWVDKHHVHQQSPFAVDVVDTTGAGDTFNAALATALANGETPARALRYASAVAALSVTAPGAQSNFITEESVRRLIS